ncbi:ZnMc domain-containing protein [Aphelenchoides besseyi]|nr:ZnMc domain-containing protein [Aphelenchoides besseyi]
MTFTLNDSYKTHSLARLPMHSNFHVNLFLLLNVFVNAVTAFPINFRHKRYVLHQNKRTSCTLRFKFYDPFNLFHDEVDYELARFRTRTPGSFIGLLFRRTITEAIRKWEQGAAGLLKFVDFSLPFAMRHRHVLPHMPIPDIAISFALDDHNCKEKFDGSGGVIAHSSYPPYGLIHLDAAENWTIDGKEGGTDLSTVVIHEVGHTLGLRHSDKESIMNYRYRIFGEKKQALTTVALYFNP